ncbi:hypothetical protein SDC9_139344 [bioreactor metagenome]|uniref:Uncharacterized protein n=1 Tax=bioreactor metagenome TaxID=1076179 RepID=A0A645DSG2_9ZZZZ
MGPGAGEAGQSILVLGQLHLQDAFAAFGVLSKNVQNEGSTVNDAHMGSQNALQLALVAGSEFIIKNDDIGEIFFDKGFDLFHFT